MNINIFKSIFEAFGLPYVGPYFTLLLFSFLAAFPLTAFLAPRFSLKKSRMLILTAVAIATSLLGSKLFHLLFDGHWARYLAVLDKQGWGAFVAIAVNPFSAGQVFYGGFIVAYLASYLLIRRVWREPTGRYGDIAAFVLAFGIAFARIGCFFAGCCFGRPSTAFGVSFPAYTPAAAELYAQGITDSFMEATPPLIPTQLIESAAAFSIFFYLCWRLRDIARLPAGFFMTRFLFIYAVFRFFIEFLRADMRGGFLLLSTSQWLSLLILAVLWIVRRRARGDRRPMGPMGHMGLMGLILAVSSTAWALPPEKKLHHYVARHWSTKEGLPHNTIAAITRTPDGLVWLATAEGLVRFDGGTFFSFGAEHIAGTAGLRFTGLTLERNGTLWAGTETGDIVRHHKGSFSVFGRTRGLPESPVQALSAAPEGIYAIVGQRLFRITGDTVAESDGGGNASLLTADPSGRVIALSGAQMHFPDAARKETRTFSQLTGKKPSALLFDGGGALYIGTVTGEILRLKDIGDTTGELLRRADGIPISAFAVDGATVWAGTQGKGLLRIARTGAVEVFDERHGLSGTIIRALHRDHDGNLWVATEQGLDLFSDGVAVTLTTLDGLSSNLVYALLEDHDGALWIGTRGGGLNRYANGKFTALTVKNGLPSDLIGALSLDDDGTLWVGTSNGLTAIQDNTMTLYTNRNGLSSPVVGAILRDREHNLWVGTLTGDIHLLRSLRDKNDFRVFQLNQMRQDRLVHQIFEDRSGRLWVAAQYGLALFKQGFIKFWGQAEGLPNPVVLAIAEDEEMNIWAGFHRGGLALIREKGLLSFSSKNGLPAEDVYAILIDDTDRLWLSTDNGIIYLSRKALLSYLDGAAALPAIGRIGLSDGMRTLECTGGVQPAALKTTNGLLYFPTVKGLVLIDPRTVPAAPEVPNTYLAALTVGDRRLVPGAELTLPAKHQEFSVEFGAVSLRHDRPFTFRYKLEGIDPDWRQSPDGRATYRDLPPGDYALLATALTPAGTPGTAVRLDLHIPDDRWPLLLSTGIPALLLLLAIVLFLRRRKVEKPLPKPLELLPEEPQRNEKSDTSPAPATAAAVIEEPSPAAEPATRQRYEKSRLDDDTARTIVTMILKYMEEKKSYKDPDITLAGLADKLDLSPHLLSQLLNDRLSRNFNAFINEYRVAEVKTMLEDPANRDKLLAIAYDAGFRSKTTFNTIFKKCTGKTPREYRKNLDGGEFLDSDEMPD